AIVDAAREGASRRFRAVMMTAVSFIIGVLPMILATPGGAHSRPKNCTTVLTGILVGTVVGIKFIPALLVLLHRTILKKKTTPPHVVSKIVIRHLL
ncbi:efflux RND transporter permease subunit, partial [Enterobacter asburiae]